MTPETATLIQYDLGQVTMSIMVAASDLGIGTGHSSVRDQELARQLLGVPDDRFVAWMMALGYPDGPSAIPNWETDAATLRRSRPPRAVVSH